MVLWSLVGCTIHLWGAHDPGHKVDSAGLDSALPTDADADGDADSDTDADADADADADTSVIPDTADTADTADTGDPPDPERVTEWWPYFDEFGKIACDIATKRVDGVDWSVATGSYLLFPDATHLRQGRWAMGWTGAECPTQDELIPELLIDVWTPLTLTPIGEALPLTDLLTFDVLDQAIWVDTSFEAVHFDVVGLPEAPAGVWSAGPLVLDGPKYALVVIDSGYVQTHDMSDFCFIPIEGADEPAAILAGVDEGVFKPHTPPESLQLALVR